MAGRPLTVEFRDFWDNFDARGSIFFRALANVADIELGSPGDICFFSSFGSSHWTFDGVKVQVLGEDQRPDLRIADFSICFDHIPDDRLLRLPIWAWQEDAAILDRPLTERPVGDRFCNFLFSNPRAPVRNAFFSILNDLRAVDATGRVFHNRDDASAVQPSTDDWRAAKQRHLKQYRFSIAFEHSQQAGYTTEKIADAFLAGSIPIYWGDPVIDVDFDPEAFVWAARYCSLTDLAHAVVELDNDPAAYKEMRGHAPLRSDAYQRLYSLDAISPFFLRIAETATRRRGGRWRRRCVSGAVEASRLLRRSLGDAAYT